MNVTADIRLTASAVEQLTIGLGTAPITSTASSSLSLASGTGANAINKVWSKSSTPAIGTPDTWTLSALTDDVGRTVAFGKVRALVVINLDAVDGHALILGNAATNPWAGPFGAGTNTVKVPAGGFLALVGPLATAFAVTAGTSDQLKVDPGANSVPYKILLVGE